jgi:hypothetical protein
MAESLPRKLPFALGEWRLGRLDLPAAGRLAASAGVALSVLGLLLLVFEIRVASGLPAYPAVALAFAAIVLLPGLLLQRAIQPAAPSYLERLALSLPLGLVIAAPAGLVGLQLHLDLQATMRLHAVFAALIAGVATLFIRRSQEAPERPVWHGAMLPLATLLAAVAFGVAVSPVWLGDRLSRDFDDWTYLTYVNSYLQPDGLQPERPVGIGELPYPRMETNVWLVVQAWVAHAADVPATNVLLHSLPPLLTLLALSATFALAAGLLRSHAIALFAVAFQLGYAILDLSPDEGFGRHLLLLMSEDKMVGSYVLFPLGLLLGWRFLEGRRPRDFATFSLICFALFVVHPQPLMYLAIAFAPLVVIRAFVAR